MLLFFFQKKQTQAVVKVGNVVYGNAYSGTSVTLTATDCSLRQQSYVIDFEEQRRNFLELSGSLANMQATGTFKSSFFFNKSTLLVPCAPSHTNFNAFVLFLVFFFLHLSRSLPPLLSFPLLSHSSHRHNIISLPPACASWQQQRRL